MKPHVLAASPVSSAGLIVCLLLPFVSAGCRNSELVEQQLRQREQNVRELRDELCRTEAYNEALRREVHGLRGNTSGQLTPEITSQSYTLRSITLGRQTGGYDGDDHLGDEALQVVIEPKDPDGHTIKAPGAVQIQVVEVNPEGLKKPLSACQIPGEQLRRAWKSGLLTTGYFLVLPWKAWPSTEKLRVVVQFQLADGRVFEADKDITIRLPPQRRRQMPQAEPTSVPDAEMLLPFPRPVDAPRLDGARGPSSPWVTERTSMWQAIPIRPAAAELLRPMPRP